jgi:hypothetical protein
MADSRRVQMSHAHDAPVSGRFGGVGVDRPRGLHGAQLRIVVAAVNQQVIDFLTRLTSPSLRLFSVFLGGILQAVARDKDTLARMAREHASAVIRDYSSQPRLGKCSTKDAAAVSHGLAQ